MTFPITIMIILTMGGLSTLFFLRKIFFTIEIILYLMIISILIQQIYTMITFNLEMIQHSGNISVFWFLNICLLIFIPCVTLWLFYSFFYPKLTLFIKVCLTVGWLLGMFGMELLFHSLGFITFRRWNIGYSFMEWLIVLIGSGCFIKWFRNLVRKKAIA